MKSVEVLCSGCKKIISVQKSITHLTPLNWYRLTSFDLTYRPKKNYGTLKGQHNINLGVYFTHKKYFCSKECLLKWIDETSKMIR